MRKLLLYPIVLFFLLLSNLSIGQLFAPFSVEVTLEAQIDSTFQMDPAMMDSASITSIPHILGVVVALADTAIVSGVHVKLTNNGTTIFDNSIPFSQTSVTTSAYTLVREGKVMYLNFGNHVGNLDFIAEAYTEDGQGGTSLIVTNQ
jgi:hypothetical protein